MEFDVFVVKKFVSFLFFWSVVAGWGQRCGYTCFLIATVDVVVGRQTGGPENCFGRSVRGEMGHLRADCDGNRVSLDTGVPSVVCYSYSPSTPVV